MLKSLKSRGLVFGALTNAFILLIAYYGQTLLKDSLETSHEVGRKINTLNQQIDYLKKPLNEVETSLYQFLLSLEAEDKLNVKDGIGELKLQIALIEQDALVKENPMLLIKINNIIQQQALLISVVEKILDFNNQQRFPTMRLMFERINPATEQFNGNIQIIENLLEDPEITIQNTKTKDLIHQVKYAWSQSVSNTRLMISSRSGIFGNPKASLEYLDNNNQGYNSELQRLISQLNEISQDESTDLEFSESINYLSDSLETRLKTLEMLKAGLSLNDWRIDRHIMTSEIRPMIDSLNLDLGNFEQLISILSTRNLNRSEYAAEQLSNFLWLFAFIFIAFILTSYLVFEHWIRIPITTVAKAMHSEALLETYNPIRRIGAIEIDHLIDTFEIMQTRIRLRQQRLTSILQHAGEGIIVINEKNQIDSFNHAAERIYGGPLKQMMDQVFTSLLDQSNTETIKKILNDVNDPSINNQQYLCSGSRSDGISFPLDLTISNMKLDSHRYNILVMRDATERISNEFDLNQAKLDAEDMQEQLAQQVKQLDHSLHELKQTQKQLVESEKMASLAGLVAGVAHEINTPIGVGVTASSHLLTELEHLDSQYKNNSISEEYLAEYIGDAKLASQIIQNNLQRAASLIHSFKQVAVDQSSEEIRLFNLKEYLQEVILNLHPRLKTTHLKVHIDVPADINLNSVPGALSQIMTNLIINSIVHAFDKSAQGNITISASCQESTIELNYQDDGKGMDEKSRAKIFEPFFTTKRGSGGSGLGMHITYNLVTRTLKGTIQCISTLNQGSHFIICFPHSLPL